MTDDRAPHSPDAIIQAEFDRGKRAFEGGQYRLAIAALEAATARVNPLSVLGGEIQMFLVSAYEGAGDRQLAQTLCRTLTKHPDLSTRDLAKRLLYILEAPVLKTRPEWIVQIPDLSTTEADGDRLRGGSGSTRRPPEPEPWIPEPEDPSHPRDDFFTTAALVGVVLLGFGTLIFWSL